MIRYLVATFHSHFAARLLLITVIASLGTTSAPAALILDSLRYDAAVRVGGTSGVEGHFKNFSPNVAPPVGSDTLPADNSLINGLTPGNTLTVMLTETVQHSTLTINRAGTENIFNNAFDSRVPYPVLFDGLYYSNSIGPNQKIVVDDIRVEEVNESGLPPFSSPGTQTVTGLGTQANPLRIQLGISADDVAYRRGAAKINIYYSIMQIPEPTSAALALLGLVGVATMGRRR